MSRDALEEAGPDLLLRLGPSALRTVIGHAVSRGVAVSLVVETPQRGASALPGDEPYDACTGVPGIELWL